MRDIHTREEPADRKWELGCRISHRGDRHMQEVQRERTRHKHSSPYAPEGEESPVSVIGHMSMQLDQSHSSSAGSASIEHSLVNFSSAAPATSLSDPPHLKNISSHVESLLQSDLTLTPYAADYAGLLTQRVQHAFRNSHEQRPHVKTWPTSTASRRMEWQNSQEVRTRDPSRMFSRQSCTTTPGGSGPQAGDRRHAATSEEERLSNYSSSNTDGQDDEDSVIDFFPDSKDRSKIRNPDKHESIARRSGSTPNGGNIKAQARRGSSKSSGSWIRGGNEHGAPIHNVVDHADADLGMLSASYKWDDARRWLSGGAAAPPRDHVHQPPPWTNFNPHNQLAEVVASGGTLFGQVQPYHQQLVAKPTSSTQDKHVPVCDASSHGGFMRETGTETRSDPWKRDIATQSTPAEWSRCNSPEGTVCTSLSAAEHNPNPDHVSEEGSDHDKSPARHNTPARRSVTRTKERGNRNEPACNDDRDNALLGLNSAGTLNLVELQSCHHLEKLQLVRDLPLGTSPSWLVADDDNMGAVNLTGRQYPPNHQYNSHTIKVNMLEARVTAWEEVERAKHIAKFKREEAKIDAWESLQLAEANAEVQKLEVKLEKMRFEGRQKILGRLGVAQRRAQEMRDVVEAQKSEQFTRLATHANQLRKSGHFPSTAFNVMCNLTTKIKPTSNLNFT